MKDKIKVKVTEPLMKGGVRDGFTIDVSKKAFEKNPDKIIKVPGDSNLVQQLLRSGLLKMVNSEQVAESKPAPKSKGGTNAKNS